MQVKICKNFALSRCAILETVIHRSYIYLKHDILDLIQKWKPSDIQNTKFEKYPNIYMYIYMVNLQKCDRQKCDPRTFVMSHFCLLFIYIYISHYCPSHFCRLFIYIYISHFCLSHFCPLFMYYIHIYTLTIPLLITVLHSFTSIHRYFVVKY